MADVGAVALAEAAAAAAGELPGLRVLAGEEGRSLEADAQRCCRISKASFTRGDRVVGLGRIHVCGREGGLELDSATGWVFELRGGKVVRAEGFLNPADALEAAGLTE